MGLHNSNGTDLPSPALVRAPSTPLQVKAAKPVPGIKFENDCISRSLTMFCSRWAVDAEIVLFPSQLKVRAE